MLLPLKAVWRVSTFKTEAGAGVAVALSVVGVDPEGVAVARDALHLRVTPEILLALVTTSTTEPRAEKLGR